MEKRQQLLAGTADLRAQLLRAGATAAALQRRLGLREYAAWLAAKGQVTALLPLILSKY